MGSKPSSEPTPEVLEGTNAQRTHAHTRTYIHTPTTRFFNDRAGDDTTNFSAEDYVELVGNINNICLTGECWCWCWW